MRHTERAHREAHGEAQSGTHSETRGEMWSDTQ